MSDRSTKSVPVPTPDQRRIVVENFERARQAVEGQQYDYAIDRLMLCCQIDAGNLSFRQALRRAQKAKYDNNLHGSRFAFFSTPRYKARVKAAKAGGRYLEVLEYCEQVFYRNPWDLGTHIDMAAAFDTLGLTDLAIFTLDQARQKHPKDATVNRMLARLFEKRGDFQKAIVLWQIVHDSNPHDVEASHKAKDLAASETIARGGYEEAATGSKTSPIMAKIEQQSAERTEKVTRDKSSLEKRIQADPTEPSLYLQLAAHFRKTGEEGRARAVLQQGLGPTGNHFSLQIELMELELVPFRKNLEMIDAKLRAIKAEPTADDTDTGEEPTLEELGANRARMVKEINTREIGIYRAKADRTPNELSHKLELGIRLLNANLVDEAITELQQARRDDKLKGKASLHLGLGFRKRNNWRLAQRNFEECLQALGTTDEPTRKEALYQLATGLAEAGDFDRALELGNELGNIDYSYRGIGPLLDQWQQTHEQK